MNKEKRIEFRLEEEVHSNYIKHAKKRKMTLSKWIRKALYQVFLKEQHDK